MQREAYERLADDLAEIGFTATLEEPIEERSGWAADTGSTLVSLVIHLAEHIEDAGLEALACALVHQLLRKRPRGSTRPPRVAEIYGPSGRILRRVDLDEDEEA
jgi:hypothetical protein